MAPPVAEPLAPAPAPQGPRLKLPPLSNPFFFQIMPMVGAGIGVGCGVGIGFGKQVPFASLPGLDGIASGVSQVGGQLRGVRGFVKKGLAKSGQKNLDVGLGCGVGVGYGFGAGLFLKPGVGEGLVDSAKAAWAGAQEQLHTRYGHLLPKTGATNAEPSAEVGAPGPTIENTGVIGGRKAANSQQSGGAVTSESEGETVPQEAVKAEGVAVPRDPLTRAAPKDVGATDRGPKESKRKGAVTKQGDADSDEGAKWSPSMQQDQGGRGDTVAHAKRKSSGGERDKELNRLQLENDVLRETLRQRELIEHLEGEVQTLREMLSGKSVCSRSRSLGLGTTPSLEDLCFKCRRVALGRRR
ncbi:hypothetical protein KFL_000970390 [Klebsormidium nitens]|uniref:Uncharacterized protein n=1 Tax=Klebsormidium nitens TaxID=105231 RepID=A0A0U9I762_KLENI|nr:hypothetical protein KFL_000970390 [Klebsormidium nitens]|eukprot:GAQ82013.1 hypothetical protein KFL_000970390 [Klebsormidium nitens]